MTPIQESLFDAPATQGASRKADPPTSKAAAESVSGHVLRDQQALVLQAVAEIASPYNRNSATAFDVVCRLERCGTRIQQNVAAKRIGELVDAGYLYATPVEESRPGSSGRPCRCFALTLKGHAFFDRKAS